MFTVFKVANVITATVGGVCVGGGRVRVSARARVHNRQFPAPLLRRTRLKRKRTHSGEGGAVFSIIPPRRRIRERLVFRLVRCDECGRRRTEGPSRRRRSDKERGSTPVNYRQVLKSTQ